MPTPRSFVSSDDSYGKCIGVRDDEIRVHCHLFADHVGQQREVEQFWLDVLELPETSLRKSVVNKCSRSSQRKRTNRLPHGTFKLVGSIQEFAGFSRPEWLDC